MDEEQFKYEPFNRRHTQEYAVVILLPADLDALVAPHRERYDPTYHKIGAHISLVFPFSTQLTLDELTAKIAPEFSKIAPLRVRLSSIADFYPQFPVIYWQVKNDPAFNTIYKLLHARLDLPLLHKQYVPHVTVAREISAHRVLLVKERIVPYLPDEEFEARAADLVSMVSGHWVSVRTFPLSGI